MTIHILYVAVAVNLKKIKRSNIYKYRNCIIESDNLGESAVRSVLINKFLLLCIFVICKNENKYIFYSADIKYISILLKKLVRKPKNTANKK